MVHFGALLGLNMLCGIIAVHESQISVSTSFELSPELIKYFTSFYMFWITK